MATDFQVTQTQPWTYQNPQGQLVEGFKVWFYIPQFGETHFIYLPNLNRDLVQKEITNLVNQRKNLATI